MEMTWSRWFRCESSFGLLLVPSQPGVFALAEEVAQPGPNSRRMLAVFEVAEADDLSRAMSRLFAAGSPWREKMAQASCFVRYAVAPSIADRRTAATALKNWLRAQRDVASQIFEKQPMPAQAGVTTSAEDNVVDTADEQAPVVKLASGTQLKTVAETAVDRVTDGLNLRKAVSAGA